MGSSKVMQCWSSKTVVLPEEEFFLHDVNMKLVDLSKIVCRLESSI